MLFDRTVVFIFFFFFLATGVFFLLYLFILGSFFSVTGRYKKDENPKLAQHGLDVTVDVYSLVARLLL